MGLYVDSALLEEVSRIRAVFPIEGVTTNPTILLEAVERGQRLRDEDVFRGLLGVCDGAIFAQPTADDADGLCAEGERYLALAPERIVLKLPLTAQGLTAAKVLRASGARIAFTAVASLPQAYIGLTAGADWIISYFSRLRRAGIDACERTHDMARLLARQSSSTRLMVASVKSSADIIEAALAGANDITARPEVISGLLDDALTTDAVAQFAADWRRLGEALGS